MPISTVGKKILRSFRERYGTQRGEQYFYSKENSDKEFRRLVTGKSSLEYGSTGWWLLHLLSMPTIDERMAKAKLAAYKTEFQGLPIVIETNAGCYRHWKDKSGKCGSTLMEYPYGFIKNTLANDLEEVDCFIGPNDKAENVYVIDHMNKDNSYDEVKCFMGFDSVALACSAFLHMYDNNPSHMGKIRSYSVDEFKQNLFNSGIFKSKI